MSQSTGVIATAANDLSDVPVHRQSRVQCDTKQLDGVTERHYCSCNIDAAGRRNLVALDLGPTRTASVLVGLRSSPFSRNQRATSSTHIDTGPKDSSSPGRTAMYSCVSSAY